VASRDGRSIRIRGGDHRRHLGNRVATAESLADLGANVILVGRDLEKVNGVVSKIRACTGSHNVVGECADLSLMHECRELADRLKVKYRKIDLLIHNAGALFDSYRETAEGVERTLAINLLAPFALTTELLPLLRASGRRGSSTWRREGCTCSL